MFLQWLGRPLYEADKDTGDAGGDTDQNGKIKASDILNRYGKNEEAALRLAELYAEAQNEMWRIRERNRVLKQERDDLKGKLPADGMVVIAKEDAALLESYKAMGKPADLKTALETKSTAEQELTTLKREKQIMKAADAAGYKASVLGGLAGDLDIQVRPVKDGKPLVVVVADGNETALEDYAKEHWEDYLPALIAKQSSGLAPDINAGARGNNTAPLITDKEREAAQRRYSATF